jgi:CrcB protein
VDRVLLVALGGAIGTIARYLTSLVALRWFGPEFPYGTLLVNLAGAFVIGLVQELAAETTMMSDTTRLVLTTGMMGGLTTYSTFSYETVRLMQADAWTHATINVFVTTAVCLTLCFLGIGAARLVVSLRG